MRPISPATISPALAAISSDSAAVEPSPCPSWSACGAYDGEHTDAGREALGIIEGSSSSDNFAQGRIPPVPFSDIALQCGTVSQGSSAADDVDGAVAGAKALKLGSRSTQAIPEGLQCDWPELGTSMMSTVCSSSSLLPMPPSTPPLDMLLFALAPPVSEQSSIAANSFTSASAAPTAASVTGDASPLSGSHTLPEDPSAAVDTTSSFSLSEDRLLPFRYILGDLTV